MKLTKTPPAAPVKDEFDRFLDRVFTAPRLGDFRLAPAMWSPSLDFSETDSEYVVRVEAPGIPKDDLEVNLDGQNLTIAGRRTFEAENRSEEFFWREREEGRFVRSVQLPSPVKGDAIDARYSDGILTVRLPKATPSGKSTITVK